MSDETMTIDKLARELAAGDGNVTYKFVEDRARLGILEGMKLQRERDADFVQSELCDDVGDALAAAIRSAL